VLAFVAAPAILRTIFRVRGVTNEVESAKLSSGWGGSTT
jgi:hypothetical protein